MLTRRTALFGATAAAAATAISLKSQSASATPQAQTNHPPTDISELPRRKVALVPPPSVHAHEQIAQHPPSIIEFEMRIDEAEIEIDDEGTMLQSMSFEGSIPGPLMVVHEGDYVELTLINPPKNALPHNIDFHAATGAMGGGTLTLVIPGEKAILHFKATRPGVFVYHCAPGGEMIPWHVVSGMSGAIMILPRDGL